MLAITAESKLAQSQKQTKWSPVYKGSDGHNHQVKVEIRYDDECGNKQNSFSITGSVYLCDVNGSRVRMESCGCIHEDIAEAMPNLAPFLKWHLCSSDGPMHYLANAVYAAGERDCHGLLKGEFRQFTSKAGELEWIIDIPNDYHSWGGKRTIAGSSKPESVVFEYKPWGRTGEGKARELDNARHNAVWLDATEEDLIAPGLKERLEARLPKLLVEFRAAIESLGFVW